MVLEDWSTGQEEEESAVASGEWPLESVLASTLESTLSALLLFTRSSLSLDNVAVVAVAAGEEIVDKRSATLSGVGDLEEDVSGDAEDLLRGRA